MGGERGHETYLQPFSLEVSSEALREWKRDFLNEEVEAGDEGAVERGTLAKIDVTKIIALFDDDPIAQGIVIGMMDGARGEELEQASGLSPTEYESKRKKIRRRIEKLKT